jgi:hypothetical protein
MMRRLGWHRGLLPSVVLAAVVVLVLVALTAARVPSIHAQSRVQTAPMAPTTQGPCTSSVCTFQLHVNPGLLSGSFACPAIQKAQATITITNRFVNGKQNDVMTLTASGLPKNLGFDMFLVQNSPLDSGTFSGFGFGWYQSDVESNSNGNATVVVQGVFDKETFIENPSSPFTPIHTFNVGFWFDSPINEQQACGNSTAPKATPFNGEQDAGLLAMITQGEPLQFVQ